MIIMWDGQITGYQDIRDDVLKRNDKRTFTIISFQKQFLGIYEVG